MHPVVGLIYFNEAEVLPQITLLYLPVSAVGRTHLVVPVVVFSILKTALLSLLADKILQL